MKTSKGGGENKHRGMVKTSIRGVVKTSIGGGENKYRGW